jgi:hypothetical protein
MYHKILTINIDFVIYIQEDATLHSLFYLETALHVLGGTIIKTKTDQYATHSTLKQVPTLPQ